MMAPGPGFNGSPACQSLARLRLGPGTRSPSHWQCWPASLRLSASEPESRSTVTSTSSRVIRGCQCHAMPA
eukprot:2463571-Rhodomonas_salina.1